MNWGKRQAKRGNGQDFFKNLTSGSRAQFSILMSTRRFSAVSLATVKNGEESHNLIIQGNMLSVENTW